MKTDAKEQAAAQYQSIVEMLSALDCDYDRLEELREDAEETNEEFQTLISEAGDCTSREAAEERIQEDPLSIEVRSDWVTPGEDMTPSEFQILLCAGGPAVRIRGELDEYREPCRAWIEYQDWGTPWTQYFDASQDTLLQYAQQFYFGE
jgi:hypothetical protein